MSKKKKALLACGILGKTHRDNVEQQCQRLLVAQAGIIYMCTLLLSRRNLA